MTKQLTYLQVPTATERTLQEQPAREQPLARLQARGTASLSDAELLTLVLQARDITLALRLLQQWDTLEKILNADPLELNRFLNARQAACLRAADELSKRAQVVHNDTRPIIRSPSDLAAVFEPHLKGLDHEELWVAFLNTKNRVLGTQIVYRGSLHTTVVRLAEIFAPAIRANASAIAIAHNHPLNDADPSSPEDVAVTKEIVKAGELLDITLIDHLIIGSRFVSLKERGLL